VFNHAPIYTIVLICGSGVNGRTVTGILQWPLCYKRQIPGTLKGAGLREATDAGHLTSSLPLRREEPLTRRVEVRTLGSRAPWPPASPSTASRLREEQEPASCSMSWWSMLIGVP
jgi:hypothetical protein